MWRATQSGHSNVKRRSHTPSVLKFQLAVVLGVVALTCTRGVLAWCSSVVRARAGNAAREVAGPQITKLEPPNWWTGFTPDLELMITGKNLDGAKISSPYEGVSIQSSKVTDGGNYMFVWLRIAPSAHAGTAALQLKTPAGSATIRFPFEARSSTSGKFQGFSQDDVIYLIMPDRFADGDRSNDNLPKSPGTFDRSNAHAYHGGDLRGIREHLDYLRGLGVSTIWLTPIVQNDPTSAGDYHGYGAVDEYAVEDHFGTLGDLQDLVRSAHAKGIKILFDFVPNHVGPRIPWVDAPPEPDWFHGTKEHHRTANGNFEPLVDPHAPPRLWLDVVDGWFAGVLPDLNQDNPDVAEYFIQNALWWAEETGIDGYRLDTFPYVSRRFWHQWHDALLQTYPHMTTVGEVSGGNPVVTSFFAGGRAQFDGIDSGVTTVFDYPLYYALRAFLSGSAPPQKIVDLLSRDHLYPHPEILVPFLGNHDVSRVASAPGMTPEKLKLGFSLLLAMRGIPELYYGDEIGMTGGDDPDNRRDFPGGFPGDPRNAFLESGRTRQEQELFAHVQRLLALRREHPALRRGQLWNIEWNDATYSFARTSDKEKLLIVMNIAANPQRVELLFSDTPLACAVKLSPLLGGSDQQVQNDRVEVSISPQELQIYSVTQ
jgi:neopullulanase